MSFDDNQGLFWTAPVRERTRGGPIDRNVAGRMAALLWDTSSYVQPELIDAPSGCVALDFETQDPTLLERGSAWAFSGIGGIIGMAVAWEGFEAYYPIRHREGNTDEQKVLCWLARHLKRPDIKFICANAAYDIGWARKETGFYPAGGVEDVQFMAALLDEYRLSYSLDSIAKTYLKIGKASDVVTDIAEKLQLKYHHVMGHLKELPGSIIAPYASMDARLTYDLHKVLMPEIEAQGLAVVHKLESALIPMSVDMKRRGIRVNVTEAERLSDDIKNRRMPELQAAIEHRTGIRVEPWEADTLARALAECGIECEKTRTGQAKVDQYSLAEWAKKEPVAEQILQLRKMSKIQNTFLDGHIIGHQHEGRIHADFNQLKSEREGGTGFGTVSGRYSSTSPNLQQIPTRDKEWGPLMRSLFLPEEGQQIASLDYSSQEPRLMVHFAAKSKLRGAAEAVQQFRENPRTDYHQMVADIANIPRSQAKTINLGCFGPDTRVLTSNGIKPIPYVTAADLVWDGIEWVTHEGILDQGEQDTILLLGDLFVTTDHRVLCGTQWVSAIALAQNERLRSQALATGSAKLPSQGFLLGSEEAFRRSSFNAIADHLNTESKLTIYTERNASAQSAARNMLHKFAARSILTLGRCLKMITESGSSTDYLQLSGVVKIQTTLRILDMENEGFELHPSGLRIEDSSCSMLERFQAGITRVLQWTERTTIAGTNPGISDSSLRKSTTIIDEQSQLVKKKLQTYDIASAGPRSRFTIVTAAGPLIVHNCAYGMGGAKLAHSLGLPTEWMAVEVKNKRHEWTPINAAEVDELRSHGVDCVEVAGDEAKVIMKKWEEGAPFVRGLYKLASDVAAKRGFIRTLLGRRCRFQLGKDGSYDYTHKAMNRLAQGSAADQTKQGMLDLWNMGHTPLLTVHDELVFSVDSEAEARGYSEVMEHAVELEVPSIVDVNLGVTWGAVEK